MAQGTTTDSATMAQFANRATEVSASLTQMLTTLMNNLSGLEGSWRGLGGTAFAATKATVQSETTRLNTALSGIATDVGTAGTNYANADSEQQSQMSAVNNQTSGITSGLTGV